MIQRTVNPWKLIDAVLSDFDLNPASRSSRTALSTELDVLETSDRVMVIANLPGIKPENISLDLVQNVLTLEASLENALPEGAKVLHAERGGQAQVKRSVHIPVRLSSDDVQANLENGVLTVTLKKAAEATPKRITVNATPMNGTINAVQG